MRNAVWGLVACCLFPFMASAGMVIDHNCTDLAQVPDQYLQKARQQLRVSFAHGAAAAQVTAGLLALQRINPVLYNFSMNREDQVQNALSFWDHSPSGELGLEEHNNSNWAVRTEKFLTGTGKDRNVVIWAWNRDLGNIQRPDFQRYLKQMAELEKRFPDVKFVYMTGPLDGAGENSELHRRNEMIRKFCRENGKILFDFADIESFSPTGKTNYFKLGATPDCYYTAKGKQHNWAVEWTQRHPEVQPELPDKAPQTHPLNASLKARAFWWMMACMAGWVPLEKANVSGIRPLPRAAAAVAAGPAGANGSGDEKAAAGKLLYRFDKIQDYRFWVLSGATGTLIPEKGAGMIIPPGKPAVAMHRGLMCVSELEFKAVITRGSTLNWYINTDWNDSWIPALGVGGVFSEDGALLVVNGEKIKFPNPIPFDHKEHRFSVWIKNNRLSWAVDGKTIITHQIPSVLAERQGVLALGGWESQIQVNAVFVQPR